MEGNEYAHKNMRMTRRQVSDIRSMNHLDKNNHKHRFSEPKNKSNLIKINKNKLPIDFFQNKEKIAAKYKVNHRFYDEQAFQPGLGHRKAESQRLHYSPQKTSYFGCFTENQSISPVKIASTNLYNRHFETREEPKRETFAIQPNRKLTTAATNHKNQFLEVTPPPHKSNLEENSQPLQKTHHLKMSPRKEWFTRGRQIQPLLDPENVQKMQQDLNELSNINHTLKSKQVTLSELSKEQQMLNITFFKGKSTSFPPINRNDRH